MTTIAYSPPLPRTRTVLTNDLASLLVKIHLRRCMVVSVGLVLAGLSLPFLILLEVVAVSLPLIFTSLALVATGTVLSLVYCGEL